MALLALHDSGSKAKIPDDMKKVAAVDDKNWDRDAMELLELLLFMDKEWTVPRQPQVNTKNKRDVGQLGLQALKEKGAMIMVAHVEVFF